MAGTNIQRVVAMRPRPHSRQDQVEERDQGERGRQYQKGTRSLERRRGREGCPVAIAAAVDRVVCCPNPEYVVPTSERRQQLSATAVFQEREGGMV